MDANATSLFDLSGKVAIITGSSRGIGRAIAEEFALHGAKVVISSRRQDACDLVAAEIDATFGPGTALPVAASISDKDALHRLVDETADKLGRIDILVCNAASNPYYGPMSGISDDQFRKIFDNNVLSNHWLIQRCVPQMEAVGEGSVIIVSSIGGLQATTVIGGYNISKAADFQLARNLSAEYGERNIRFNCLAPGIIRTQFARALWENPDTLRQTTSTTPMRRIGDPREIAGAAVFLGSKASSFMTGQTVVIDGGQMALAGAFVER